ncbi:MAG TPA: single-stranded DNA-binding protein [Fimbriimonadaceae bacterium]
MINRVVLVGRLTRDPELRTTTTGKSVCDFSIAVNKRIKPSDGSPDADFFRVQCWEKTADYVTTYLTKGRLIAVDGRLTARKFTASDGTNREVVEVVAESVQGLDRPRDDAGGSGGGGYQARDNAGGGGGHAATAAVASAPSADEYDPFADE